MSENKIKLWLDAFSGNIIVSSWNYAHMLIKYSVEDGVYDYLSLTYNLLDSDNKLIINEDTSEENIKELENIIEERKTNDENETLYLFINNIDKINLDFSQILEDIYSHSLWIIIVATINNDVDSDLKKYFRKNILIWKNLKKVFFVNDGYKVIENDEVISEIVHNDNLFIYEEEYNTGWKKTYIINKNFTIFIDEYQNLKKDL